MCYRLVAVIVAVALVGCNPPRAGERAQPMLDVERVNDAAFAVAQWKYVTKDGQGNPLTEGLLTMPYPLKPGVNFIGSWQARYVGPQDQREKIGPQINGGRLSGEFDEGQLRIQLNPNMADNNVTLIGALKEDRIDGSWVYSTFAGVTNKGTFEALLSKE
jgi:hypothetical protein